MDNRQNMAALRRSQDTLSLSGLAVIGFTIWDFVKACLLVTFDNTPSQDSVALDAQFDRLAETNEKALVAVVLFLLGIMLVDIALHLYVGISAYKEAHGKRRGWAYVVLAVLMAVGSIALIVFGLYASPDALSRLGLLAGDVVEFTSIMACFDLVRSAVEVKRLSGTEGR